MPEPTVPNGNAARRSPRQVLAVLFVGVLMGALDIAIVGPALPAIRVEFDLDGQALSWIFNVYILFNLLGAPLTAKVSDRIGRRDAYLGSIVLFVLGSIIVAAAPGFTTLLVGRAVQAFGAGGIFPVAAAVIGDTFPAERRGRALGMIGAVFGIAFLLGPLLGGVLLRFSWHWLFLINVPIGAVVLWQAWRVLPGRRHLARRPFDLLGAVWLIGLLVLLAFGIGELGAAGGVAAVSHLQGWLLLGGALIATLVFGGIERRAIDPILHPDLLGSRELKLIAIIALATGFTEAAMVFLPSMAVGAFGVSEATASFMLLPLVATLIIGAPTAGRLVDAVGAKRVIQGGLACCCAGLWGFGLLELTLPWFFAAGALTGLGLAVLLGAPLRYVVIREVSADQRGSGQGLLTLSLSIGQLAGAALVGGVTTARAGRLEGYQEALLWLAVGMLIVLLVSGALRRDAGSGSPRGSDAADGA